MLTANSLTIAPDAAEELARRVTPVSPPPGYRPGVRAAWWLDSVRLAAPAGTPAPVLLRAAALVAERFEGRS